MSEDGANQRDIFCIILQLLWPKSFTEEPKRLTRLGLGFKFTHLMTALTFYPMQRYYGGSFQTDLKHRFKDVFSCAINNFFSCVKLENIHIFYHLLYLRWVLHFTGVFGNCAICRCCGFGTVRLVLLKDTIEQLCTDASLPSL